MFDNLMQNLFLNAKNKLDDEKKILADKIIEHNSNNNELKIVATADGQIKDIKINISLDQLEKEMLEDLLVININNVLKKADEYKLSQFSGLGNQIMPDFNSIFETLNNENEQENQ